MPAEAFVAFPSKPAEIEATVRHAVTLYANGKHRTTLVPWTSLDVSGRVIAQTILAGINRSVLLFADISVLNPNVSYEVGYAVGSRKPIKFVLNKIYQQRTSEQLRRVGIFDTLGYHIYENASDLADFFGESVKELGEPLFVPDGLDRKAPVYLVDAPHQSDVVVRIAQQAKKHFILPRVFDPREKARLPVLEAVENVARSRLVVVSLLPLDYPEAEIHNIRSAFVAGVAHGVGRSLVIFQLGHDAPPLDFRDDVTLAVDIEQVDRRIQSVAPDVFRSILLDEATADVGARTFLESLNIGSNVAEEEEENLIAYYHPMDPYLRAERGEARVVLGRKGSGKTALFYRLARRKTEKKQNIVLDLQPESYQLIKFKENVLRLLSPGTQLDLLIAIWDYVLLLEAAHQLLEIDKVTFERNHRIFTPYIQLNALYYEGGPYTEADFSERLARLLDSVTTEVSERQARGHSLSFSSNEVIELIYKHPIKELRESLLRYMREKEGLWILIDHLDKGWSAAGLEREDIQIVRGLLDASGKIQRAFRRGGIECCALTFLRNDVYELLVDATAESGKISRVSVDCTDSEALKQILALRLEFAGLPRDLSFEEMWVRVSTAEIDGQSSVDYILERSLMRPRAMLGHVAACRSRAVNRGHERMEEDDVRDGTRDYSQDLLRDVMQEMGNIAPQLESGLYALIDAPASFVKRELLGFFYSWHIRKKEWERLIEFFLWYGVLGVEVGHGMVKYIYDFNYDFRLLKAVVQRQGPKCRFWINPAFRPALDVSEAQAGTGSG